jgi:CheY-like chemotaxis protein
MEIYLKRSFQIDTVQSGRLALKQVLINQYDIILMDINLGPDMDGIQVTKEIRKFDQYKNIPIVAVTGFSTDEEKEIILRGGLNGILSKPFTRDELIAIVTLNLKF